MPPPGGGRVLTLLVGLDHARLLLGEVGEQVTQHLAAHADGRALTGEQALVEVVQDVAQHVVVLARQQEAWRGRGQAMCTEDRHTRSHTHSDTVTHTDTECSCTRVSAGSLEGQGAGNVHRGQAHTQSHTQ